MYLVFEMAFIREPCLSVSSEIQARTKGAPASEKANMWRIWDFRDKLRQFVNPLSRCEIAT